MEKEKPARIIRPAFRDNNASPINTDAPLAELCPRAGVFNPIAYDILEMDASLVEVGIDAGDDVYTLSTADIENGDLVAVKTPDALFVRFVEFFVKPASPRVPKVRLKAANPEVEEAIYDYDDDEVKTRWRAVWVCRHSDHARCSPFKRDERKIGC